MRSFLVNEGGGRGEQELKEFEICFVTIHRVLANQYGDLLRKIPGVAVHVFDADDIVARGLNASDFDVVIVSRLMGLQWSHFVDVGQVVVDENSRCLMSIATTPHVGEGEAWSLGFEGGIDLRRSPGDVITQLKAFIASPPTHAYSSERVPPGSFLDRITDETDRLIIALVSAGLTDKQIAGQVFFSPQTVRNRVSRILRETGFDNRVQLAVAYFLTATSRSGQRIE